MAKYRTYWLLLLVGVVVLQQCNTTQHFVPMRPVTENQFEVYVSLSMSLNQMTRPAIQGGCYYGISNKDAVGLGLWNLFFPSYVSYIRYWNTPSYQGTVQFHVNDWWGMQHNPPYEGNVSLAFPAGDLRQSVTGGIGYYTTPLIGQLLGAPVHSKQIVPILSYQLAYRTATFEWQYIGQFTQYQVRRHKSDTSPNPMILPGKSGQDIPLVYAHDSVQEIIQHGDNIMADSTWWEIAVTGGDTLLVRPQDPYADCIGCAVDEFYQGAYPASPNHRVVWIYPKDQSRLQGWPRMLELNMPAILATYHQGGALRFVQDDNILEQTLHTVQPWRDNSFFSIGTRWHE